jgi:transposase InsO family protein
MDLVGPARVCSAGGKWYVLVIVDDYSCYAWVFFLADKGETFGFVWDLILRLKNERNGDVVRPIHSDNGNEFKNSRFETFFVIWVLNISFLLPMWLVRMM